MMKANHGGYSITASVVDEHVPKQGKYGTRHTVYVTRENQSVVTDVTPKSGVVSARCARLSVDSGRELVTYLSVYDAFE